MGSAVEHDLVTHAGRFATGSLLMIWIWPLLMKQRFGALAVIDVAWMLQCPKMKSSYDSVLQSSLQSSTTSNIFSGLEMSWAPVHFDNYASAEECWYEQISVCNSKYFQTLNGGTCAWFVDVFCLLFLSWSIASVEATDSSKKNSRSRSTNFSDLLRFLLLLVNIAVVACSISWGWRWAPFLF